jgi:hypothetical protein
MARFLISLSAGVFLQARASRVRGQGSVAALGYLRDDQSFFMLVGMMSGKISEDSLLSCSA